MTFIADPNLLVVLNVLIPIALGMDVDLLRTFLVFNAQLVIATAPGELSVLNTLRVLFAGKAYGTGFSLWYRQPVTSG